MRKKYEIRHIRQTSGPAVQFPSCSLLIKQLGNDVIMAHSAWHEYRAMSFR